MSFLRWLLFLPASASTFSDRVDMLHAAVISVTMLLSFGIAAFCLLYVTKYRRRHEGTLTKKLEVTSRAEWVIIGTTLGSFVLFWILGFAQYVQMETPPADAMEIRVTAKQWMWKFAYPDGRRSAAVLTVPAGRPIKLVMTSRDVIHSFFVPAFRIKQDVLPGRFVTAWFEATTPGTYDLYCTEYCGLSHSNMLGSVRVLAQSDYANWLATAPQAEDEEGDLVARGAQLAVTKQCVACHSANDEHPNGPSWRGLFGSEIPLVSGLRVVADDEYLTRSMMDPNQEIHEGYGPTMPTYRGVLSASEAAALVAYIESLAPPKDAGP